MKKIFIYLFSLILIFVALTSIFKIGVSYFSDDHNDSGNAINLTHELFIEEGKPLSVITYNHGKVVTVNNSTYSFNEKFIKNVKEVLYSSFEENMNTTYYSGVNYLNHTYYGFSNDCCSSWFLNNYYHEDFLSSIYMQGIFEYMEIDGDSTTYTSIDDYKLIYEDDAFLSNIFDGKNSVFTYCFEFQNKTYEVDLPLLIEGVGDYFNVEI